ncbi:methylglyoxal reductase (NADPH-dependent) gre2 [Mycoblastus sanguinarius]|nr:methylglyoxal reductase (NADPH-dependent) gre2 [Mycoblastus sanguinarius]
MSSIINQAKTAASQFTGSKKASQLILLTGASGFVAAHVLNSLLQHGYSIRGTVRSEATAEKVRKTHSHLLNGDNSRLTFAIVPDVAKSGAFDKAVKDVDGVIHTASPFVMQVENNERDLLDPAIKGTTEILKAVQKYAPQVKRIVITSSFAAIVDPTQGARPGYTYSEKDWNPVTYEQAKGGDGGTAYCASKKFAEKAAWDFVEMEKPNFDVATICPPMIYGPLDHDASLDHLNTSSSDIYRFMNGSQKEVGPTAFPAFADVRDVGEAHVKAYENSQGSRWLIAAGNFQYPDVCEIIRKALPAYASKVPDPSSTEKVDTFDVDNNHAKNDLGLHFIPLDQTISDTAKSLARLQEQKA